MVKNAQAALKIRRKEKEIEEKKRKQMVRERLHFLLTSDPYRRREGSSREGTMKKR